MFIKFSSVILSIIGNKTYFASKSNFSGRFLKLRKESLSFDDRVTEVFSSNENTESFSEMYIVSNRLYVKSINLSFNSS